MSKKRPITGKTVKASRFGLSKGSYEIKLQKLNIDQKTKQQAAYLEKAKIYIECLSEQAEEAENENDGLYDVYLELAALVAIDVSVQLDRHIGDLKKLKGNANNGNNGMNALASIFGQMGVAEKKKEVEKFESLLSYEIGDDAFEYLENLIDFLEDFNEGYRPFLESPGGMVVKGKSAQFTAYKTLAKVLAESILSAINMVKVEVSGANSGSVGSNNEMNTGSVRSGLSSLSSRSSSSKNKGGDDLADIFGKLSLNKLKSL